ncbi:MAG: hypothetical protein R3D66_04555 [Alphaproteobacteria bacterium]
MYRDVTDRHEGNVLDSASDPHHRRQTGIGRRNKRNQGCLGIAGKIFVLWTPQHIAAEKIWDAEKRSSKSVVPTASANSVPILTPRKNPAKSPEELQVNGPFL